MSAQAQPIISVGWVPAPSLFSASHPSSPFRLAMPRPILLQPLSSFGHVLASCLFLVNAEPPRAARTARGRNRGKPKRARGMFRDNEEREGQTKVVERARKRGSRGERNRSQEKGEVADLELPRSSGRLHPASSCAPREKDTLCSLVGRGFTKSFKFVRTVYKLDVVKGCRLRSTGFNLAASGNLEESRDSTACFLP